MKLRDYRMKPAPCLNCGALHDAAAGRGGRRPRPGDFTVCIACRHVMAYAADRTLRNLTDDEIVELAGDPELLAVMGVLSRMKEEMESKS